MNAVAAKFDTPRIGRASFDGAWGQSVEADAEAFFGGARTSDIERLYDQAFVGFIDLVEVEPDAARLIEGCREAGRRTAVVTNSPRALAQRILRRFSLNPDALCTPSVGLRPKPMPDLLLRACAELEVAEDRVCFVGDTANDRRAAEAADIFFCGYGIDGDCSVSRLSDVVDLLHPPTIAADGKSVTMVRMRGDR